MSGGADQHRVRTSLANPAETIRDRLVLAIDGGGTKTAARLLDPLGKVLAEAMAGPCNLYQDAAGGLDAIGTAWREACANAGLAPEAIAGRTILSAGLAGVSAPGASARFRARFAEFAARRLSSDGYAGLIGAFEGRPGSLLSIGTGVVAHRLAVDGTARQFSGWGFPVGDRGGGAWLGFRALGDWLEAQDGMAVLAPSPALSQAIEARLGSDRGSVLAWLRAARSAEFAALAPAVIDAAKQQDRHASALLDEAVGHLVRLVRALGAAPCERLVLSGGLAPFFAPRLEAALGPGILAPEQAASALHGAWLIARGVARPEHPEID